MSRKADKNNCLSEKISSLINSKPSLIESDDEDITTVDKIKTSNNESDFSADELEVTNYRKLNCALLDEEDSKYSGKGISRKDFAAFDKESSESEDYQSDNEDQEEGCRSDEGEKKDNGSEDDEENDNVIKEIDDEESENELKYSLKSKNKNLKTKQKKVEKEININKDLFAKVESDAEKGKAIKNQLLIWDILLDYRLKFQKCLNASNQFPNFENFNKFKNQGGVEFEETLQKSKKSLTHLLNSLITLQDTFLKSNKEFVSTLNSTNNGRNNNACIEDPEMQNQVNEGKSKLKNISDFSKKIVKNHQNFETYRNNVIQKWNDKTRLGYISHKNFSAFEQSTLKQIEHVLLDRQRLISRTQMKRSNYHILGCNDEEPPPKKQATSEYAETENLGLKNKVVLNKEIFDDDDFYHQLLSELVKRKASDITDPVQLGRQWMQLQKIRSKIKKTVDTKASKGRKVRYVVHPKLVNFMMPNNESWCTENSRVDLLNSLFGKKIN